MPQVLIDLTAWGKKANSIVAHRMSSLQCILHALDLHCCSLDVGGLDSTLLLRGT